MNELQREQTKLERRLKGRPMHSPMHHKARGVYLVTGVCYEHQSYIGLDDQRMESFSDCLISSLTTHSEKVDAWVVLPNHYHAVVSTGELGNLVRELGQLHGRSSFQWNGEDDQRGRKVWFNLLDRRIESERHHITAIQYVHHNPVKHGHAKKWHEWKWSSAQEYIKRLGRDEVLRRWNEFPFGNFGRGWDD